MPHSTLSLAIPGPPPMRVVGPIGNMLRFHRGGIQYTSQLFQRYGPLVALAQGGGTSLYSPRPGCPGTVMACGPDYVKQVTTQSDIYHKYPLIGKLYPGDNAPPRKAPLKNYLTGLFALNGEAHKRQRRLLMPAFQKAGVEAYVGDMAAIALADVQAWQAGEVRDIARDMHMVTLRIVLKTLLGQDLEQPHVSGLLLHESVGMLSHELTRLLPFDIPGLPYHRLLNLAERFEAEMRQIIRSRRESGDKSRDVLSILMQAAYEDSGERLSEDELIGHVGVIYAAGHETTAKALTWTLFFLSQQPQVVADLQDELRAVLGDSEAAGEQLARLVLLERVIKESLRVLSPVPWNARLTSRETQLGPYPLPAGCEVMINLFETHRMAEIYPAPDVFDPGRWERIEPSAFEYNPFSTGSRACIGATFSMVAMKVILATVLRRFRLQFVPQVVDCVGHLVLKPKRGMKMLVRDAEQDIAAGVGQVRGNITAMVRFN